jgi:hypothetical protein
MVSPPAPIACADALGHPRQKLAGHSSEGLLSGHRFVEVPIDQTC